MGSGIQDIPLRIPEKWDPKWFAQFVREVLALADVRNLRTGSELELTGQSSDFATLQVSDGGLPLSRLEQQAALTILGNPTNAIGDVVAIAAASDTEVFRRSGTSIGFGTILSAAVSDFAEAAQDAVGVIATDTTTINFTYTDATPSLTADVIAGSIDNTLLANMAQSTIKGRAAGAGTGVPTDLSAAQVATLIGGALAANPTGSVGLSAVNGTATTYMRSDAAPALSQSIAPTWSGQHAWSLVLLAADAGYSFSGDTDCSFYRIGANNVGIQCNSTKILDMAPATTSIYRNGTEGFRFDTAFSIRSTTPRFLRVETDAASDEGLWVDRINGRVQSRRVYNDAESTFADIDTVTRIAGSTPGISAMTFGNTTDNPTFGFLGTGTATFSGQATALRFVPTSATVATNGMYLPAANTVGLSANSTLSAQLTATTFQALLQLILSGEISPTQLTANTDNWAPTGLSTATVIRVSTDASRNLTGITGGAAGRVLTLINVGAQPLVLVNDATSTAANRFLLASGTDSTLQAGGAAILWYDTTSSRWRHISRVA